MAQFHLDEEQLKIFHAGIAVTLLPKEFALFQFLYTHPNQTFSRDSLLDHVWPLEDPIDRTVDDHIYRLRKKLDHWYDYFSIDTVRGLGYRFHSKNVNERNFPSLQDKEFNDHFSKMLSKYHLFGQGEALQALASQQQVLGVKLNPFYEMYTQLLAGNWAILLKESIPFWERAYFSIVLYGLLEEDSLAGENMIKAVLEKNDLELSRKWELQAMDLPFFLTWRGDYRAAWEKLEWAYNTALKHGLEGFKLAILIQQMIPSYFCGDLQTAAVLKNEVELRLQEKPYLREQSYYKINCGICEISEGQLAVGKQSVDKGIEIMKNSRFELQHLHVLTHVVHLLRHILGHKHEFVIHYYKLRAELLEKHGASKIKKLLLKQLLPFL